MMISKNIFILFLIFSFLFSCSSKNTSSPLLKGELLNFVTDTIYLEKDLQTKTLPLEFTYQKEGDQEFLYGISGYNLLKYDYLNGKLVSKVTFEKEGPDGIGTYLSGMLITSEGVFFISNQKEIICVDLDGHVIKKISLPMTPENRMASNFNANQGNKMNWDLKRKSLMVTDVPFLLKEPILDYQDWIWEFDFKEDKKEVAAQFRFPERYREFLDDPELGIFYHLFLEDQNKHLISFPANDSLLVIKSDAKSWVYAGSRKKLSFQKGIKEQRGEYTVFLPSTETSRYKELTVDPFQKLIFRHLIISQEKSEEKTFSQNSLIILDESFKHLGELEFSTNQFSSIGFSTPNGLYLKLKKQNSDDKEGYVRLTF